MPLNNSTRLNQTGVDDDSQTMARPGGAASKGSTSVNPSKGSAFAGMEAKLLSGLNPDEKKLSGNTKPSRAYETLAGGGAGSIAGAAKLPLALAGKRLNPAAARAVPSGGVNPVQQGKKFFSSRDSTTPPKGSVKKVKKFSL